MDPLLYDLIIKLACLFCGLVSIALGAFLLLRGVKSRTTSEIKLGPALLKGAAPGTIFAITGAAIIYFAISTVTLPKLGAPEPSDTGMPAPMLTDTATPTPDGDTAEP